MWDILPFDIRYIIFKTLDTKHKKLIYYIDREQEFRENIALDVINKFINYGNKIIEEKEICSIFYHCLNNMYRKVPLPINSIIKKFSKSALIISIYKLIYINNYNRFYINNRERVLWFLDILRDLNIWNNIIIKNIIINSYTRFIEYIKTDFNTHIPYWSIKTILHRINKRQLLSILTHFNIHETNNITIL